MPDIAMLFLTGGLGDAAEAADDATQIAYVASVTKNTSQFAEDCDEATMSLNAERFASQDVKAWPELSRIGWLSEEMWEGLKGNSLLMDRLSSILEKVDALQNVSGIKQLAGRIRFCSNADQMEGHLLELNRAAQYARNGQLQAIEETFNVEVILPGKPVRIMRGEADLALNDGTLVEVKHRRDSLQLD